MEHPVYVGQLYGIFYMEASIYLPFTGSKV
jgi:hypothetical protein